MDANEELLKNLDDPRDEEAEAADAIRDAAWWTTASLVEHWPVTTDEAVRLLYLGGEFDVEAGQIEDLIGRRLMPAPGRGDAGQFEWSATDIVAAAILLETRRQWSAAGKHEAKKTIWQIAVDQLRNEGELTPPPDMPRQDLRHLLLSMIAEQTREGRERIFAAMQVVAQAEHGIRI